MKNFPGDVRVVLLDLDGTLLDSAPDLYAALRIYCEQNSTRVPPYTAVRAVISRGCQAILRCAFHEKDEALLCRVPDYFAHYATTIGSHTRPFDGIEPFLDTLEAHSIGWGVVTNKPDTFTRKLLDQLDWSRRVCALVCGDTLPVKKPDPAPVRLACEQASVSPEQCLFVGDDSRDVEAGRCAGLYTVAAGWGYLGGENPSHWQADVVLEKPAQLLTLLGLDSVT